MDITLILVPGHTNSDDNEITNEVAMAGTVLGIMSANHAIVPCSINNERLLPETVKNWKRKSVSTC